MTSNDVMYYGKGMIVGNDVSGVGQGQIDFSTYKNNTNFLLAKATQGVGFIDPWYGFNRQQARNNNVPFGSYHFANPDLGNSAEDEAAFFCNVIDGDPIREGEVLALDFEVSYSDPVAWCLAWLNAVSAHYNGLKPFIYLNQALASNYDWTPVIEAGYALWIADYTGDPNNNIFQGGQWQTAAIQQWTDGQTVPGINGAVDGDVFFGTVEQFKAYGYNPPVQQEQPVTPPATSPAQPQTPDTSTPATPPPAPTPPTDVPQAQANWPQTLQAIGAFIQYWLGKGA